MKFDVRLRLEGALLERLIQQAILQGARFGQIQRCGARAMILTVDPVSAEILMRLCKKYGLYCRELSRSGFSAAMQLLRQRWTILPGIALCIVICALFLGRIWMVDIVFTDDSAIETDEMTAALEEKGVKIGMRTSEIDCSLLQKQLLAATEHSSFIGARIQGVRLLIEVNNELPAPDLYNIDHPRDLVASRSGVIEEISVYSGEACVQPGDTVQMGDTLIRGLETIGKDAETHEEIRREVSALGSVKARCWFEGRAEAPLETQIMRRTGRSSQACRLHLLNWSLPLAEGEEYACSETETRSLHLIGLYLPIEIERRTQYETIWARAKPQPEDLRAHLTALARADAQRQLACEGISYEISSQWTDESQNENTLQIRAVYEIYTDIAVERDALIEEVY